MKELPQIFQSFGKILFSIIVTVCLILPSHVAAQDKEGADQILADTKADMITVVGVGLAGAVLGLSTLSFYSEPKDHLKNILVGGAIGIIIGVGLVAYNQATKSRDTFYQAGEGDEEASYIPPSKWENLEQVQTAGLNQRDPSAQINQVNFTFTF